jgi:hypothetical protein
MAVSHSIVALNSSTAVALNTDPNITNAVTGEAYPTWGFATVSVQNVDPSATVYIGSSGVTSSSYGASLLPGASISLDGLNQADVLYAISSGSSNVAVFMVTTA